VLTYQNGNKRTLKLLRGRQVDEGSPILESIRAIQEELKPSPTTSHTHLPSL